MNVESLQTQLLSATKCRVTASGLRVTLHCYDPTHGSVVPSSWIELVSQKVVAPSNEMLMALGSVGSDYSNQMKAPSSVGRFVKSL